MQDLQSYSKYLLVEYLNQILNRQSTCSAQNGMFMTDIVKKTLKMAELTLVCLKHDLSKYTCSTACHNNSCKCNRQLAIAAVHFWSADIQTVYEKMKTCFSNMQDDRQKRELFDHFTNVSNVVSLICEKSQEKAFTPEVVFENDFSDMDIL